MYSYGQVKEIAHRFRPGKRKHPYIWIHYEIVYRNADNIKSLCVCEDEASDLKEINTMRSGPQLEIKLFQN